MELMDEPKHEFKPLHDPIGVTRGWLNAEAERMGLEPDEMLRRLNMEWPTVVVGVVYYKPEL